MHAGLWLPPRARPRPAFCLGQDEAAALFPRRGWLSRVPQAPPATPATFFSNLVFWVKSDTDTFKNTGLSTPATADGDTVAGWKDQSGNAHHVTVTGTGANIVLKTGILNGLPAVRYPAFGSTNQQRLGVSFTLPQPAHVFMVVNMRAWNNGGYLLDGSGDTMDLLMRTTTPNFGMFAGSHGAQNADLTVATDGTIEAQFNGASSKDKVNNGTYRTGNCGTSAPGGVVLGAGGAPSGSTSSQVDYYEVAVCSSIQDATALAAWVSYANARYGFAF